MLLTNPITQTPKKKKGKKKRKEGLYKERNFLGYEQPLWKGLWTDPNLFPRVSFSFFFFLLSPFPRGGRTFSDIMLDPVERVAFRRIVRSLGRKVPVYVRVVYLRFHHESRERERERERMGQKGYPRFHFGSLTLSNPLSERFSDPTIHPMCQCA